MGRQLKVAAIVPLYPPQSRVGAWLATHSLLRGLADRGHDVRAVTFLRHGTPAYRLDGIRVLPSSQARTQALEADVVVAHLGSGPSDPIGPMAIQAPLVRMCHGLPANLARLDGCALLVANSASTLAAFDAWPGQKILCRPPTDPAEYATGAAGPLAERQICVVNLSREKGGDLFWAIAAAMPEERFLAVRGGYGRQIEHARANVHVIGPNVAKMGQLVYARSKLLLSPSRAETWGMAAVEAMCAGLPVLARPTEGLRESLGAAGNWQEGDDPQAWAAAIRALLEPERHAQAARLSLARAAELDPQAERDRFADAIEALAR